MRDALFSDVGRINFLQCCEWLSLNCVEAAQGRAASIETMVRDLSQMVVIDLAADDNAEEIADTLNARGAQPTAGRPDQEPHVPAIS
jgi:hypothetical protein